MTARVTKTEIRRRLKSAKSAAECLEENVRWLVSNRVWEVMGYGNFVEFWEVETGEKPSRYVKVIGIDCLAKEGMSTARGRYAVSRKNGHNIGDIAKMIGLEYYNQEGRASLSSVPVWGALAQIKAGIPLSDVTFQTLGSRARQRKSLGLTAQHNELVNGGWSIYKYQKDAVKEIARKAGVPDSVVIRSALDMYLNRNQKETG